MAYVFDAKIKKAYFFFSVLRLRWFEAMMAFWQIDAGYVAILPINNGYSTHQHPNGTNGCVRKLGIPAHGPFDGHF